MEKAQSSRASYYKNGKKERKKKEEKKRKEERQKNPSSPAWPLPVGSSEDSRLTHAS
jgi:hypothetical protein